MVSILCHSSHEVWRDWTEVAAITAHQAPANVGAVNWDADYQRLEKAYLDVAGRWERNDLTVFAQLFGIVQLFFTEGGRSDFLGEVYHELELTSSDLGQFFTPYAVAKLSAGIMINEGSARDAIREKGFISILEPASGAGGMLIASAERIESLGHAPHLVMYFEATDIERTCFNMTYIQMSALGVPGIVIHGNSLTNVIWERRGTLQLQLIRSRYENSVKKADTHERAIVPPTTENAHTGTRTAPDHKVGQGKERKKQRSDSSNTHRQMTLFDDI